MRACSAAGCLILVTWSACLNASILPTVHLDSATLKIFQDYIANFEKTSPAWFQSSGKLWIDDECCGKKSAFESRKPVLEARRNEDVENGSIHHFSGAIRIDGGTIEAVRHVMQDYPDYPKYFKPDIAKGSGTKLPDSKPEDEHYRSDLMIVQSTLWMSVAYNSSYDTHYLRPGPGRWMSRSSAISIKELRDPKDPGAGTFPEGDDHGFLWKTNTYWFARERNGGLDLGLDSITLSRPVPTGFAWWGTRRTREAVDRMLQNMKAAVESLRGSANPAA
jgi:hypothetical protein